MKKFKSLKSLYNAVLPALKSKKEELHREKYVMIKEEDIWNYLSDTNWSEASNLELATIVDDILNVDGYKVSEYIKVQMDIQSRYMNLKERIYNDDEGIL